MTGHKFKIGQVVNFTALHAGASTSLDNQLHKALKALRDTQEWRLKALDGQAVDVTLEVKAGQNPG